MSINPPYAGIYDVQNMPVFNSYSRSGPHWLPRVSSSSVTKLHDTASRTLLSQNFVNPSSISPIANAKYTFPLYESCAIVSFRCYVGTRLIEGVIKEKQEACAAYQAAVEQLEPASLLEEQTSDVFSTSLGNIPPGATVRVEIEYIIELKHDAEIDGLRFTIPTSIAPRYGDLPSGLSADTTSTGVTVRGMNISVEVSMSSNIQSVQSPSHPISIHLGGHSEDIPDNAFNPHYALATLGQTSTELGKDFILLIKCASLSSPSALLETHPTIPNSKALMLTLVPKFNLPESSRPEVVFIVDRSGSMSPHVAPLKSSLSVFLKSLPLGVNFNISSFGSNHSFLWDRSRPYSNRSFAEAQRYCDSMTADFGGTEILPPIKSTIAKRFRSLNLEIMVLTDGQVWNSEKLFEYVEKETKNGDVRLFSLGIGQNVSHALIDGLARVGRGFSQVVSDEREGMESKVARMLRGALSAHVLNYRVEWEGKPSEDDAVEPQRPSSITRAMRRVSLFDTNANPDSPISFTTSPDFVVPSVLQAPHKLQPLFPFSRSTAYVILSSDAHPPPCVWLRGTTPAGDELELEIVVQTLPEEGETIHQLAARKILQELKDGIGYLHSGRCGVIRQMQPQVFGEWVKKEGVRIGLKYGVASQWTSFVAVVKKEENVEEEQTQMDVSSSGLDDDDDAYEFVDVDADDDDDGDGDGQAGGNSGALSGSTTSPPTARPSTRPMPSVGSMPIMMMMPPPPPAIPYPTKSSSFLSSKLFPDSPLKGGKLAGGTDTKSYSSYPSYSKLSSSPKKYSPTSYSSLSSSPPSKPGTQPSATSDLLFGSQLAKTSDSTTLDSYLGSSLDYSLPDSSSGDYDKDGTSKKRKPRFGLSSRYFSKPRIPSKDASPIATPPSLFESVDPMIPTEGSTLDSPPNSSLDWLSDSFSGKGYDKLDNNNKSKPLLAPGSKYFSRPIVAKPHDKKWSSKGNKFDTPDIAITYSPPSAPPAERLTSEAATQPLSMEAKTLIGLQTSEGYFMLDSALATLLGVPITILEAKLMCFAPTNVDLSREHKKSVWATLLAIRLFETQLGGERSVWQLVVDKARVWLRELATVGDEDIEELEKLVGEVLGV